jgi:hypothetical protein
MSRGLCSLLLVLAAVSGCDSCRKQPPLATLIERGGEGVQRDYASQPEQWEPAHIGAEFNLGDGVRANAPSSAGLVLNDGANLSLRPGTMIRFLRELGSGGQGEHGIDVLTGRAVLTAGSSELRLRTHVGSAVLSAGGQLLLTREADGLRLQVDVGKARLRADDGRELTVGVGESVLLEVGMAVLRKPNGPAIDPASPPSPAGSILVRVDTAGVKVRLPGGHSFGELPQGEHTLAKGSTLRLPADLRASLARGGDRAELEGAGDFSIGEDPLVTAQRGNLELIATSSDVEIDVPGGKIIARAADGGSRATVRLGEQDGYLVVEAGTVTFRGQDGQRELSKGTEHRWSTASTATDETAYETPPDFVNLEVSAGESFVVHAPEVPVAVRFDFSERCKDEGQIELMPGKRRSRGTGRANLLIPAGARSYSVRCLDAHGVPSRAVVKGSVDVLLDPGTRKLPPKAPTSLVEADGRSYTIHYQNQLPDVRVRWPNPPTADAYTLDVDGTAMSLASPEHEFKSGSLRDGVHRLTFQARNRRSRTANVEVRFDNTAPTASLTAPVDRAFQPGATVQIEGVALPAWKVTVQGGTIDKAGDRFQGQAISSAERPDIAVRLSHPRLGTHYYLRRAAGSE